MADYSAPQQGGGMLPQSMSDLASGLIDPSLTGGQYLNPAYATPAQRANLYALSTALQQPQQIKNGWQGIASMVKALIGGYYSGQADRMEQGGTLADQQRQQIINQVSGANGALEPSGATSAPAPYGGLPSDPTSSGGVPSPGGAASGAPPDGSASQIPKQGTRHSFALMRRRKAAIPISPRLWRIRKVCARFRPKIQTRRALSIARRTAPPFSFGEFQLNVRSGRGRRSGAERGHRSRRPHAMAGREQVRPRPYGEQRGAALEGRQGGRTLSSGNRAEGLCDPAHGHPASRRAPGWRRSYGDQCAHSATEAAGARRTAARRLQLHRAHRLIGWPPGLFPARTAEWAAAFRLR